MAKAAVCTVPLRDFESIEKIRHEWVDLMNEVRSGCPFAHPEWVIGWARHYVRDDDLEFLALREGNKDGRLIGVAPFYRRRFSALGIKARALLPVGAGKGEAITELMEILIAPERVHDVLREVVRYLADSSDCNWSQLPVAPSQGWPLPQWLDSSSDTALRHEKTKACVVLTGLPDDSAQLASRLKRNLKESLRRTRNRSAKLGGVDLRCARSREAVEQQLSKLFDLHRARSSMPGKVSHPDVLSGDVEAFLRDVIPRMADGGLARIHYAERGGRTVAAQLVLTDGYGDYVSISGLDPDYWELGLNTMLTYDAVVAAITDGRQRVNLSAGPNVAKFRWTTEIECYQEFSVVGHGRQSQLLHGAYLHASIAIDAHRERSRHRVR